MVSHAIIYLFLPVNTSQATVAQAHLLPSPFSLLPSPFSLSSAELRLTPRSSTSTPGCFQFRSPQATPISCMASVIIAGRVCRYPVPALYPLLQSTYTVGPTWGTVDEARWPVRALPRAPASSYARRRNR
ncbi:hypothetical protein BHE74_00008487 [Ensete ventricosum]|nr:hypothetical protein BHE74_00008487 [Ensete ventricosum]RZS16818.1 hypothetical protein BHM03_00048867 [Ensete ventricosum]